MLSIQINTKILNWPFTISSTTSNCPSLQAIWNRVFHNVRLLDTLDYEKSKVKKYFVVHNFDLLMTWRIEEKKAQKAESFALGNVAGTCMYVCICVQWQYLILMQIYYNKDLPSILTLLHCTGSRLHSREKAINEKSLLLRSLPRNYLGALEL